VEVESGGLIGLLEHELVVAGERLPDLVESLLRKADVEDGDLVTLYWGAPIRDDEARATEQHVGAAFPRAEVELVEGAQPHYHFIISVE
jgi:dihydroxyacetone kinase-like predicted kinase